MGEVVTPSRSCGNILGMIAGLIDHIASKRPALAIRLSKVGKGVGGDIGIVVAAARLCWNYLRQSDCYSEEHSQDDERWNDFLTEPECSGCALTLSHHGTSPIFLRSVGTLKSE